MDEELSELEELQVSCRNLAEREERVLLALRRQQEARRPVEGRHQAPQADQVDTDLFHIGQHVFITNRITHVPILRRATPAD